MPDMLRRLFLILSLALLFGLGQQGVAVHAISHLADEQQESPQDQKSHHLTFCDQCAAYAALDSAVGASAPGFAAQTVDPIHFSTGEIHRRSSHTRHYAARAPPLLA